MRTEARERVARRAAEAEQSCRRHRRDQQVGICRHRALAEQRATELERAITVDPLEQPSVLALEEAVGKAPAGKVQQAIARAQLRRVADQEHQQLEVRVGDVHPRILVPLPCRQALCFPGK